MKIPPLRILLPATATLSIVAVVFVLTLVPLGHITDFGKEMHFDQRMLAAHLYEISPVEGDAGRVHFVSDGTLGNRKAPDGDYWVSEFDLAVNDVFWSLPRRNAYTEFRLHSIEPEGVVIEYEARFTGGGDPRQATAVDHGLVRLSWKTGGNPYRLPPMASKTP